MGTLHNRRKSRKQRTVCPSVARFFTVPNLRRKPRHPERCAIISTDLCETAGIGYVRRLEAARGGGVRKGKKEINRKEKTQQNEIKTNTVVCFRVLQPITRFGRRAQRNNERCTRVHTRLYVRTCYFIRGTCTVLDELFRVLCNKSFRTLTTHRQMHLMGRVHECVCVHLLFAGRPSA